MRVACVMVIVLAALPACGPDERPGLDATSADARADAGVDALVIRCGAGDPLCPAALPYCCGGLEDPLTCTGTFIAAVCTEHPVDGIPTDCDVVTGDGCTGATPICCGYGSGPTYCTSHAYLGFDWTCSPG